MVQVVKQFNILVVDDEVAICKIMSKYLRFYKGFQKIVIARDGVQAMQKLQNQQFDLVITDLVMPYRDGFSLIDNVRKIPKYYKMKFMIVSGCLSKEKAIMAMRKGIRHIVVKPFSARQLLEKTFDILEIDSDPKALADRLVLQVAERMKFGASAHHDLLIDESLEKLVSNEKEEE